ncbi:MAG: ExeA family protein [Thermogutta sp.]
MYEQFFHFKQRPFSATPYPWAYVPTELAETARKQLLRTILRGEGPGLLVGPPGTGKTLILHVLKEQCRSDFDVVFLTYGRFPTARALLQTILHEVGQPFQGMEEAELRISLADYLNDRNNKPVVVLADEAETLKFRVLDELRVLTNVQRTNEPTVRLVLAGSPALEEKLTSPKLQSLNQRIAVRCYLDALNRADTFRYVRTQVARAGATAERLFPESALQAVYHATGGVPRLINQICDHALVLAYADGIEEVTAELVQEAWSDLQQIPIPWGPAVSHAADKKGIIEIGSLTDEPSDAATFSTPMVQENDLLDAGTKHFGFTETPNFESPYSPHLLELASPADADGSFTEEMEGPDGIAIEYPTTTPNPRAANEAEKLTLEEHPDPLEKIDHIEQAVKSLQDGDALCEPQKPQAELVFYDWGDPFEETFLQEIPVHSNRNTGQQLALENDDLDETQEINLSSPIGVSDCQKIEEASSPHEGDAEADATCQKEAVSSLDTQPIQPECPRVVPPLAAETIAQSSNNDVEGENPRAAETCADIPNLAKPTRCTEESKADSAGESAPKAASELPCEATFPFSLRAKLERADADNSQKHRAIMKSLFTRLRKSG